MVVFVKFLCEIGRVGITGRAIVKCRNIESDRENWEGVADYKLVKISIQSSIRYVSNTKHLIIGDKS